MRRPGLSDLDAAARVLLALPPEEWPARAARMVDRAHLGDRLRKRLRRPVAGYGTGSLGAEAMRHDRVPMTGLCDAAYCAALMAVLDALAERREKVSPGCN